MKALGIIPADAELPPRNPGDAAWDELGPVQRKVYAASCRLCTGFWSVNMVGRMLDYLHETGQDRNTLIVVISDNGAASRRHGRWRLLQTYGDDTRSRNGGTPGRAGQRTLPLYQRPWGMTGAALSAAGSYPYLGGVRTPLMVSWPALSATWAPSDPACRCDRCGSDDC